MLSGEEPRRQKTRGPERLTAVHDSVRIGMMNRTRRKRKV